MQILNKASLELREEGLVVVWVLDSFSTLIDAANDPTPNGSQNDFESIISRLTSTRDYLVPVGVCSSPRAESDLINVNRHLHMRTRCHHPSFIEDKVVLKKFVADFCKDKHGPDVTPLPDSLIDDLVESFGGCLDNYTALLLDKYPSQMLLDLKQKDKSILKSALDIDDYSYSSSSSSSKFNLKRYELLRRVCNGEEVPVYTDEAKYLLSVHPDFHRPICGVHSDGNDLVVAVPMTKHSLQALEKEYKL